MQGGATQCRTLGYHVVHHMLMTNHHESPPLQVHRGSEQPVRDDQRLEVQHDSQEGDVSHQRRAEGQATAAQLVRSRCADGRRGHRQRSLEDEGRDAPRLGSNHTIPIVSHQRLLMCSFGK